MERKKEQKTKAGLSRKDIYDALKGFCKENLELKFEQIDKRFEQVDGRLD